MKQTARPTLSGLFVLVLLTVGTSPLPAQILDLNPQPRLDREGTLPSNPEFLADLYGIALFRAYEPVAGAELWRTDGTRAGTYLLADMTPGPASSTVWNVAVAGAQAFVAAGSSLWLTDGTTTGTYLIRNFGTWNIAYLTTLGDLALFDVYDGPHGQELWRSDGTAAGTYLLKDTLPGSNCGDPRPLARVGDLLFFSASAGGHRDLWRTDGTVAGTILLKTFQYVYYGAACNNEGYFSVAGMAHDLWKSDGTIAGTVPVKKTASGTRFPTNLVALGRTLVFEANKNLWASDGTTAGTQVISSQVAPYFAGKTTFVSSGDAVYFNGNTSAHGLESVAHRRHDRRHPDGVRRESRALERDRELPDQCRRAPRLLHVHGRGVGRGGVVLGRHLRRHPALDRHSSGAVQLESPVALPVGRVSLLRGRHGLDRPRAVGHPGGRHRGPGGPGQRGRTSLPHAPRHRPDPGIIRSLCRRPRSTRRSGPALVESDHPFPAPARARLPRVRPSRSGHAGRLPARPRRSLGTLDRHPGQPLADRPPPRGPGLLRPGPDRTLEHRDLQRSPSQAGSVGREVYGTKRTPGIGIGIGIAIGIAIERGLRVEG